MIRHILLVCLTLLPPALLDAQDFWVPVDNGIVGAIVESLHNDDGGRIYAATDIGIYASDNGGVSWRQLPLRIGLTFRSVVVTPAGALHADTYDSLYSS